MTTDDRSLKSGWTRVALGDVVRLSRERAPDPEAAGFTRYVGLEHIDPGDLTIRRWGNVAEGTTFTNVFRPGQVLFGKRRAYLRKVAVPDFSGVCSGDIYVLESKDDRHLLPDLLPFICQTDAFFEHAVGTSAGSLSPRTNWRSLAKYEITLPPLAEQRRLAVFLWAATETATKYRKVEDSLSHVEISLVEETLYKSPADWIPVTRLLKDDPRNGISPPAPPTAFCDGGLKTVSIGAVSRGSFEPTDFVKPSAIDIAEARPFLVRRGDAFVVRGNGNRSLCGLIGLSEQSYDDLFYPDLLIRLRFNETLILPDFAVIQWNTPRVHRQLISRAKSTNGTWKINGQDVRAHRLRVPSLAVQHAFLHAVRRLLLVSRLCIEQMNTCLRIRRRLLRTYLEMGDQI